MIRCEECRGMGRIDLVTPGYIGYVPCLACDRSGYLPTLVRGRILATKQRRPLVIETPEWIQGYEDKMVELRAVLRLLGESAPEMVNTTGWMPPSPLEHEPPAPGTKAWADNMRAMEPLSTQVWGMADQQFAHKRQIEAVEGKADANQDHIEKLLVRQGNTEIWSGEVDARIKKLGILAPKISAIFQLRGSILGRIKKLEKSRVIADQIMLHDERLQKIEGLLRQALGRIEKLEVGQGNAEIWAEEVARRIRVLETARVTIVRAIHSELASLKERLAALEAQAAACAAGECHQAGNEDAVALRLMARGLATLPFDHPLLTDIRPIGAIEAIVDAYRKDAREKLQKDEDDHTD